MIRIQRILCPTDFSDSARRALDHAVALAKWYESTVTLLHVCTLGPVAYAPAGILSSPVLTPADREAFLTSMKHLAEGVAGSRVPIEFEVNEGQAASEILFRAAAMPADLIVLGTHGRSGFERLVLGSVAEKVLRKADCPVLTVPRIAPDVEPGRPVRFKQIVCGVDFSECSMHALECAMSMAQEADAQLTVVHVIELPPDVPREVHENLPPGPRSLREYIALAEEDRRRRLNDAIPETVRTYCSVETVLTTGKPYRELLRAASDRKADLLVVGIHGRGPVDRLLFGSTAQHLVRQASCPVLTLRIG
jgi:nucleotide-binding universal stress UspA family protein